MSPLQKRGKYSSFPLGIYGILAAVIVIFFIASRGTVSPEHLLNILRQSAPLGIAAIGQTLVLLMGGIDLSVGMVITLVNIITASVMVGENGNIPLAVLLALAVSLSVGLVNGLIVTKMNMPPFLVTLAMSTFLQGVAYIYTQGSPKGGIAPAFRVISDGWLWIIPLAGIIWIAIWAIMSFVLRKTPWGQRYIFTGANMRASNLSGVNTSRMKVSAYVLCSLLAGLAGLIVSAYIGVASMSVGTSYTLDSIAATVIGGTSFSGGIGSLEGTFPGVLIMMIMQSMFTILNIPEAGKYISQGLIIAIMVAINQRKKK